MTIELPSVVGLPDAAHTEAPWGIRVRLPKLSGPLQWATIGQSLLLSCRGRLVILTEKGVIAHGAVVGGLLSVALDSSSLPCPVF